MGILHPSFKKAMIDELFDNISTNTSYYYAFASNPAPLTSQVPADSTADYQSQFKKDWLMVFGKKLTSSNFAALIQNNIWVSNTTYSKYDNTDSTLLAKNNFYVITAPEYDGGSYNVYKCIENANNSASTIKPTQLQATTFETSDGYKWRYVTSIPFRLYKMFSTQDYAPVYSNSIISIYANNYAGVDTVVIVNGGSGYSAYHDGFVQSANTSTIQIENGASLQSGYYTGSSIYLYNTTATTSQIFEISDYVANSVGKWVVLTGEANTENILSGSTQYKISPRIQFTSDGVTNPIGYTIVDPEVNSISDVVMLEIGSSISWANISIHSSVGSGANLYAIVPPPGGHGSDVISELNVKGLGINFHFANTEGNTIPTDILYNEIGIIKNPYQLTANAVKSNTAFTNNSFNQLFVADLISPVQFTVGEKVVGNTSNSLAVVAFANTSRIYLAGDKTFVNGEIITNLSGVVSSEIDIVSRGAIYSKDIQPLYVQNINNVDRSNTQTESFKLIIQL